MGDLVEEQGLADDVGDLLLAEDRLGHAREGGEFVDHPPQIADLADDRAGQLLEGAGVGADLLAVAALQPLGGELDRGQRVLDLVGDAAGDVGPGGAALVEQLLGDVVEGEDVAALDPHPLHRQRARLAAGGELDDVLALVAVEMGVELGRELGELAADRLVLVGLEQGLGRAVDQPHVALLVDRDDAGGDPGQHRLDEGAAAVELGVGRDQGAGLLLEPAGHPVEGVAQDADLVACTRDAGHRAPTGRRR